MAGMPALATRSAMTAYNRLRRPSRMTRKIDEPALIPPPLGAMSVFLLPLRRRALGLAQEVRNGGASNGRPAARRGVFRVTRRSPPACHGAESASTSVRFSPTEESRSPNHRRESPPAAAAGKRRAEKPRAAAPETPMFLWSVPRPSRTLKAESPRIMYDRQGSPWCLRKGSPIDEWLPCAGLDGEVIERTVVPIQNRQAFSHERCGRGTSRGAPEIAGRCGRRKPRSRPTDAFHRPRQSLMPRGGEGRRAVLHIVDEAPAHRCPLKNRRR